MKQFRAVVTACYCFATLLTGLQTVQIWYVRS